MRDTTPEFERFVAEQYRRLTPGERVRLCTEMFDAARVLVESSLPAGRGVRARRAHRARSRDRGRRERPRAARLRRDGDPHRRGDGGRGIEPDLMVLAKSLAAGFPLAAVVGRSAIMDAPAPGGLGGTYAGSPLACAAALAVLEVIREEHLCERAHAQGVLITAQLDAMAKRRRCIGEVRSLGAMVAMELVKDRESREPDADLTKALVQEAARRGLVCLPCGLPNNVIRFLAPLTAPEAILHEGMEILDASLSALAAQ